MFIVDSKYPDVLRRLPSLLKATVSNCVLDCEAVAYDTTNKQILPFQVKKHFSYHYKPITDQSTTVAINFLSFRFFQLENEKTLRKQTSKCKCAYSCSTSFS